MTRLDFFDICRSIGLLIGEQDEERLYEALSSSLGWDGKPRGNPIVAAYCDAFVARYPGSKFKPQPRDAKNLKDLGTSQGIERAIALIQAYFEMSDQWFLTKAHDVPTLMANLNKVGIYLDSGKTLTKKDAARLEDRQGWAKLLKAAE